jgi:histidyl-tRNA synthetase
VAEKKQFRAIKGTRDILPPDSALWNWFEQTAQDVFETFGFRDVRTPVFEETSLFARSVGLDTDIVNKEMYSFEDHEFKDLAALRTILLLKQPSISEKKYYWSYDVQVTDFRDRIIAGMQGGQVPKTPENIKVSEDLEPFLNVISSTRDQYELDGKSEQLERFNLYVGHIRQLLASTTLGDDLCLRPEATASVVRAYIEHGPHNWPGNAKLYYMGPMFRRERPQKGRYRQFYQIGAEVLGQSDAPGIDAEVIEMLLVFFKRVRLKNIKLQVNSIGCKDCRPKYVEVLRAELLKVKDQLGADSQRRIETNPLRVLDSKVPHEQPIIEELPRISDHLCPACREHFAALKVELKLRGVEYEESWRLVRGLDYYTRTTFEVTASGLGSQNAVCGGGRYDGLVELLGGPPTKGIGFAIGSDRAILSIQEAGDLPDLPGLAVFVAWMGAKAYLPAIHITRKLREAGLAVELPPDEMKFKKSLGLADKLGAKYALILGEDEVASGTFTLKRLKDADQKKMNENDLLEYLESERRGSRA